MSGGFLMSIEDFSKILKAYRKKNCLYQKQVADKLGIGRDYYCRLENGKAKPSYKLLMKIEEMVSSSLSRRTEEIKINKGPKEKVNPPELLLLILKPHQAAVPVLERPEFRIRVPMVSFNYCLFPHRAD